MRGTGLDASKAKAVALRVTPLESNSEGYLWENIVVGNLRNEVKMLRELQFAPKIDEGSAPRRLPLVHPDVLPELLEASVRRN